MSGEERELVRVARDGAVRAALALGHPNPFVSPADTGGIRRDSRFNAGGRSKGRVFRALFDYYGPFADSA